MAEGTDRGTDSQASLNVAQRILAVDAKYNSMRLTSYPRQRTLYIRRRNQLLRDNASCYEKPETREGYLKLRTKLLRTKYGSLHHRQGSANVSANSSNLASRRTSMDSLNLISPETSSPHLPRRQLGAKFTSGLVPTKSAEASRAMQGNKTLTEHYSFSGMQHLFGYHSAAVVSVQFAHNDKTRLACCSLDGTLSIFSLLTEAPSLVALLRGHMGPVNDFDWSVTNDHIVSASFDGTCRLWDSASGVCLRAISDTSGVQNMCCCFHPGFSNFIAVGNNKSQVKVFNASTGKRIKGAQGKTAGVCLTLTFEASGDVLWAGDSKGSIFSFYLDIVGGKLTRCKRIVVSSGHPISCISWRSWISREARDPSLLVNCANNSLILYRVLGNGDVYLKRKFASFQHMSQSIKSAFCPIMSFMLGACVVTGSEDGMVYFFDIEKGTAFNQLPAGNTVPILDVCWAYDESILASSDTEGTIIIWRRARVQG
jgi:WD40 repeat protein